MATSAVPNHSALERLLHEGTEADLARFLTVLEPPEIADLLEEVREPEARTRVFRAILGKDRGRVLANMEDGERGELVEHLPAAETADVLEDMQSDDAADVLQELDEATQREVLREIDPAERVDIERILEYPEDSAGGIMQTELVHVMATRTVRAAIEKIRQTAEEVGELHEVFVVDDQLRLVGWVKERALILADDDTRISAITKPVPVQVGALMDQEEIAALVRDYDVTTVPVVDADGLLVGRILVDDVLDAIVEEATEDILRQGGASPEELYEPSVASAVRSRLPWLIVTFLGGTLAAFIMGAGEDLVKQAGALFAFVPVIMGMGGGCATQTATVTVRGLVTGRIGPNDVRDVVLRELVVGLIMATITGLLLWGVAKAMDGNTSVALVAAGALFGTVCLGTFFGVITPLLFERLGVDPTVATAPFVTTMNDVLGSTIILALCWFAFT